MYYMHYARTLGTLCTRTLCVSVYVMEQCIKACTPAGADSFGLVHAKVDGLRADQGGGGGGHGAGLKAAAASKLYF